MYKGEEIMRSHLTNDCPKTKGTCTKCKADILRLHVRTHECKETP